MVITIIIRMSRNCGPAAGLFLMPTGVPAPLAHPFFDGAARSGICIACCNMEHVFAQKSLEYHASLPFLRLRSRKL